MDQKCSDNNLIDPTTASSSSSSHSQRRSSFRLIEEDDDTSDDCLIRLIKDACLSHCRKNKVKITNSNILNILNEVIGDIKMIIMIDERNEDNAQTTRSSTHESNLSIPKPDVTDVVDIDWKRSNHNNNYIETRTNQSDALTDSINDSFDQCEVNNDRDRDHDDQELVQFVDRLTQFILNESINQSISSMQSTSSSLDIENNTKRSPSETDKTDNFIVVSENQSDLIRPSKIIEKSPSDSRNITNDFDQAYWNHPNYLNYLARPKTTELFINGSKQIYFLHYVHDIYANQDLKFTKNDLEWHCPSEVKQSQPTYNAATSKRLPYKSFTPPPIDKSLFTDCQVEVRQFGSSVKGTVSRFLHNRRRIFTYAEIAEFPLVLCLDFYYISEFMPRQEIQCLTIEDERKLQRTAENNEENRTNDLDQNLQKNCDNNDVENDETNINSSSRRYPKQDYLERRRRSKFFWWEQERNISPNFDDYIQGVENDVDEEEEEENDVNPEHNLLNLDNGYDHNYNHHHNQQQQQQVTSDYQEEDDEEYRENSYDQYVFDDDVDNDDEFRDQCRPQVSNRFRSLQGFSQSKRYFPLSL